MKIVWRILGRFYFKRARRAEWHARAFQKKSEKFFRMVKGSGQ